MAEKSREREATSHGDDEREEVELTLRITGREQEKIRVQKGTRLKDFLKSKGIETKGMTFFFQGKKLAQNEEGELEDDPEIAADCLLEVLMERVVGGSF